jgi:hypothetical protein
MNLTRTFNHDGLTITIHTRNGADELAADVLEYRLRKTRAMRAGINSESLSARTAVQQYTDKTFVQIATQTDSIEGAHKFALPDYGATGDELLACYDTLMGVTGGLIGRWRQELDAVDAPPVTEASAGVNDPKGSATSVAASTSGSGAKLAGSSTSRTKGQK